MVPCLWNLLEMCPGEGWGKLFTGRYLALAGLFADVLGAFGCHILQELCIGQVTQAAEAEARPGEATSAGCRTLCVST